MGEFFSAIQKYSISDVLIIGFALYCALQYIKGKYKDAKKEKKDEMENYHLEHKAQENKEESVNDTLKKHEEWIGNDKEQIKGIGAHLTELESKYDSQGKMLEKLSETVRDLRLESMRDKILNAVPKCIDLTNVNVGSEDYTNLFQIYTTYEKILKENGMENSQCNLAMKMIKNSYKQRLASELLTDYRYLPPEEIKKKIRRADDAISWWNEDELDD